MRATVDGSHDGEHSVVHGTSHTRASPGSSYPTEYRVRAEAHSTVFRAVCLGYSTICACAASGTPAPTNAGDTNPPTRSPTISVLTLAPTFAPTRGPTLSPIVSGGASHAHSMHRAFSLGNRGHACTLGVSAAL